MQAKPNSYGREIFELPNTKRFSANIFISVNLLRQNGLFLKKKLNGMFNHGLLNSKFCTLMTMTSMLTCPTVFEKVIHPGQLQ